MKKIYVLLTTFAVTGAAMAQSGAQNATPLRNSGDIPVSSADRPAQSPVATNNDRFTIIWEDDLSDPSTWEMDNVSAPPVDFVITTDLNAPVEPNGCPECLPINTPTAANGYAWCDGDGLGTGSIQDAFMRNVTPVNCTDFSAVNLRFYCVTRNWASTYTVNVSGDGGNTWTSYPVLTSLETNTNTANPELVVVNITDVAAGQSEVVVEFNFYAEWGWWWAIDDVSLVVPDENDITLSAPQYASYDPDVDLNWENVEYAAYPISQLRPLEFSVNVTNAGTEDQTGVYLEVVVSGPDGDETVTTDPIDLPFGTTDTLTIEGYTPPAVTGDYTISYTVHQDQEDVNPDDNIATDTFSVTDGMFARDRGGVFFTANTGNAEFWGGPGYHMISNEDLYCIGAAVAATSVPGTIFNFELRDGLDIEFLAESEISNISEDMLNEAGESNYTWLDMSGGPIPLLAGEDYVAMFHHYGGDDVASVGIVQESAPDFTSYVIAEFDGQSCAPCYTASTYMVRIGLSAEFCLSVGAEEAEMVTMHELYPNPTEGQTTLEYSLLENAEVQIMLFDIQGRVVLNEDKGTQTVGEYRFDYNFSDLATGTYTLSIMVGDKAINKKLVIK